MRRLINRVFCLIAALGLLGVTIIPDMVWCQEIEDLKKGVVKITAKVEGRTKVGTGFIVRLEPEAAYVVTAAHVIEGDPQPNVSFYTDRGKEFTGKVLGIEGGDPKGLAAVLIQGKLPVGLEALLVNQTFDSYSGDQVTLIGFPSSTSTPWTVTTGSLSGIRGRDLTFSAFVDEGNSGGPLLVKGKVVGVVVGVGKEVGLAVPSPTAKLALKGWGIELGRQARLIHPIWQHSNDGWAVTLSLREKAKEIFYKLPGDVDFKSTGFNNYLNSATGLPDPRVYVATPELRERSIIQLKFLNLYGEEEGPYELVFDPQIEIVKEVKGALSTANKWLAFRESAGTLLVYFSHLIAHKGGIKEIQYSLDNDSLSERVQFEPAKEFLSTSYNDQIYINVPSKTKFVMVKVIFIDGTGSETRRFQNPTGSDLKRKGLTLASISSGNGHTCGVTPAGAAYCWGENRYGALGNNSGRDSSMLPSAVAGNIKWASIAIGEDHACGVASDGQAYCWGSNEEGQLGDGSYEDRPVPGLVATNLKLSSVSAGSFHTCALTADGDAYCWGGDRKDSSGSANPLSVSGHFKFTSLVAGHRDTCGITPNGNVYCWESSPARLTPKLVTSNLAFVSVSVGADFFCAVSTGGRTYCWGRRDEEKPLEIEVSGNPAFTAVTVSSGTACALTSTGSVYCWGEGTVVWSEESSKGRVAIRRIMPRRVRGNVNFKAIWAGPDRHVCGITDEGAAYCWGSGGSGQLGNGFSGDRNEPTRVLDPTEAENISDQVR